MQTQSHLLLTGLYANKKQNNPALPLHTWALLVGSVLPDIPFFLLTVVGEIWFRWFAPLPVANVSVMEYLHFELFFHDPLWIVGHNLFHSLLIDGLLALIGYWFWHRSRARWALALFWLGVSMTAHTIIDIFTHSSDGPLFLFPLNWTYRFPSPVSYWEASNFGIYFALFEWLLDAAIISYFIIEWRKRSIRREATK
jgi:hypothetical protein